MSTSFSNKTFNVSSNGTYSFTVEDNAGNKTVKSIEVSNIDKVAPTANLSQSSTAWTNESVTLTIDGVLDQGGSGVKHIQLPNGNLVSGTSATQSVTANGTYTFKVVDVAGNITQKSITVANIEHEAPTAILTQNPTGWTNEDVTLTLSSISDAGGSGIKQVKLPNGEISKTMSNLTYDVSTNGTYSFEIMDNAGNITLKTISITNIDKVLPSGSVSTIPGSSALTLRFVGSDANSGIHRIVLPNGNTVYSSTADYQVTTPGTYIATVFDRAGNQRSVSIMIQAPRITLNPEQTGWTNLSGYQLIASGTPTYDTSLRLQAPFSGGGWLRVNTMSVLITRNGTYTFNVNDGGVLGTASITIDNFDRVAPNILIHEQNRTDSEVNVNIQVEDLGDMK